MAMNLFSKAMVAGELFAKLSRNSTKGVYGSLKSPDAPALDHVASVIYLWCTDTQGQ
jgi:hypothetical protein